MPPRRYLWRGTSNLEDVAPTICSTICKGTQRQLDNSGAYVLEFQVRRKFKNSFSTPLLSPPQYDIIRGVLRTKFITQTKKEKTK